MSYVEDNLMSGEKIIKTAKIHWMIYLIPALLIWIVLPFLFSITGGLGAIGTIIVLLLIVTASMTRRTTELALTNKRVITKHGWISRKTEELKLSQVESLSVDQGILGRMFNYGTVVVRGTGLAGIPLSRIAKPQEFRKLVNEEIEKLTGGTQTAQPAQTTEAA